MTNLSVVSEDSFLSSVLEDSAASERQFNDCSQGGGSAFDSLSGSILVQRRRTCVWVVGFF